MKRFFFLLLLWMSLLSGSNARAAAPDPNNRLSIGDATILEGNSRYREMLFPVSLPHALAFDISASFVTKDITATAGSDYTPYTPQSTGQIVIKAGQTRTSILIRVTGDTREEKDETFLVQLGAPKRVLIADSDGIGTIVDDDYSGQITISDTSFVERNTEQKVAKVQVTVSPPPLHPITVSYKTSDDSAKASQGDYIATKGSLLFKPGRLVFTVAVPVVGDTTVEADERFFVRIEAPGYNITKGLGTITILNDDATPASTPTPSPTSTPAPPPVELPNVTSGNGKIAFASILRVGSRISVINADGSGETQITPDTLPGISRDYADTSPSFSRDGTKITFVSTRDGKQNIYVMNADGSNPQRLTSNFYDESPAFSPDGSKIAWASLAGDGRKIFVMNADGTQPTHVATRGYSDSAPQFSSDGSKIVFTSLRPPVPGASFSDDIFAVNLDGSNETRLTTTDSASEVAPATSSNGAKIAFVTSTSGDGRGPGIYSANFDGGSVTQLTQNIYQDATPQFSPDSLKIAFGAKYQTKSQILVMNADGSGLAHLVTVAAASQPSWAPGSVSVVSPPPTPAPTTPPTPPTSGVGKIVFTSRREHPDPNFLAPDIYIMNADGTAQARLTFTGCDFNPNLSRDGTKIVWMSHRDTEQIYVMGADGSNPTRIGDASTSNFQPCFSPDGSKILFASRVGGISGIYLMNADGTGRVRLSDGSANDTSPRFSPDGSKIVFASTAMASNSYPRIWTMNADGTGRAPLTTTVADDHPSFSPDAKTVLFASGRYGASGVYSIGVDGYNEKHLSFSWNSADRSPCYSPDGQKIAFYRVDGGEGIYIMNADGSGKVRIPGTGRWDDEPSWANGSVSSARRAASAPSGPPPSGSSGHSS